MRKEKKAHIFLVDDDKSILQSTLLILRKCEYECSSFTDANSCLTNFTPRYCDLLITDIHMPGIDGIELLNQVKKTAPWIPVVIMTGYADVPKAVHAVKSGAFDFMEKPFEIEKFIEIVERALRQHRLHGLDVGKSLTRTETVVLKLILDGRSNKEIANTLKRSERTIEVHRRHIMNKLDVHSTAILVRRAVEMGLNGERRERIG